MMDFDHSNVALLSYTPLHTDAFTPQYYDPPQCMDTGMSITPARTSADSFPGAATMIGASSPMCGVGTAGGDHDQHPPPYGYSAAEPAVSSRYDSSPYYSPGQVGEHHGGMHGPYTPSQASSPALSMTTAAGYTDLGDLDSIPMDMLLPNADPGPPPVRISGPRLPEDPPSKKESAFSAATAQRTWIGSGGARSMPHSPSDTVKPKLSHSDRNTRQIRSRSHKHATLRTFARANSPMFPDQSTPLSSVNSSLSRQPSITSLSSSDQFGAPSISVRSDPGVYRHEIHPTNMDSAFHSPTTSFQDSPKFVFGGSTTSPLPQVDSASRSCLELEMPAKYSKKICDLDKKILKLQAERSKLLEKVHLTKSAGTGPMPHVGRGDIDSHWTMMDKSSEIGRVLLYIFPLGIREFDEPIYEEANAILRQVGGVYFDLQRALSNLRDICCKGSVLPPDISTCFAFIRSLLNENQRLKLTELANGIYRIQLDLENGLADGPLPQEFYVALNAANEVLMSAQHITQSYSTMMMNLQKVRQRAAEKAANFEKICDRLEIVAGERKDIKSVLDGYKTAVASAERVWPQYYQVATNTISTITECIHPSIS